MPKEQKTFGSELNNDLANLATEYKERMDLVKYFGLAKSLETAALILGPSPGSDAAESVLPRYTALAEAIDQWLLASLQKLSPQARKLSDHLKSKNG